ncbi:MAG: hypothetical protein EOO67_17125 [Microbacterium sp.]|nr:MAG: hypothetical protein EOO67_17125 [Microbacterium sp.]
MRRILLVVGLLVGLVFLTPTAALACSCVQQSTAAAVKKADTVVEATLAWTTTNGVDATYGVDVEQVYKGRAATFEKLRTAPNAAACGLGDPVPQRRYVFFLKGEHPGQMQVEACGGSALTSDTLLAEVRASTGDPSAPVAAAAPVEEAGHTGLGFIGWTLVVAGVGLIVLLGTTALKRSF